MRTETRAGQFLCLLRCTVAAVTQRKASQGLLKPNYRPTIKAEDMFNVRPREQVVQNLIKIPLRLPTPDGPRLHDDGGHELAELAHVVGRNLLQEIALRLPGHTEGRDMSDFGIPLCLCLKTGTDIKESPPVLRHVPKKPYDTTEVMVETHYQYSSWTSFSDFLLVFLLLV